MEAAGKNKRYSPPPHLIGGTTEDEDDDDDDHYYYYPGSFGAALEHLLRMRAAVAAPTVAPAKPQQGACKKRSSERLPVDN